MKCVLVVENSDKSIVFFNDIFYDQSTIYHSDIFDKDSHIFNFIMKYSNDVIVNDYISVNDKSGTYQSFSDLLGRNESYDICYLFKPFQNQCEYVNYNLWDLYIFKKWEYDSDYIENNSNLKHKHYIIFKDLLKIFSESIQTVSFTPYIKYKIN